MSRLLARRTLVRLVATAAVVFAGTACGSTASAPTCAHGPGAPGVRATLTADLAFSASDANNLSRRFYTAGATCVALGNPGSLTLEVSEQGITGARADQLLKPGRLAFVTWVSRRVTPGPAPLHAIDPAQVPVSDGGTCAASTARLECAPAGYGALETGVDGNGITAVSQGVDRNTGQRVLTLTLTAAATARLAEVTARMPSLVAPSNELAIFLDGAMVNNAAVQAPLNDGQVQVSGGAIAGDKGYAATMANLINTGRVTPYRVTSQSNL